MSNRARCIVTPLQVAAVNADAEAHALLAESRQLRGLIYINACAFNFADTVDAWRRARARAETAHQLAEHSSGTYNAWSAA
jgi:hypothetical protein